MFKGFVKLCVKPGLYGKELAAIDGNRFKAVNSRDRNWTEGKLKERLERLEKKTEEYLREMEESDLEEGAAEQEKSAEETRSIVKELEKRKERCQGYAEEMRESGETQKPLADPDSRLMPANGRMDMCYNAWTAADAKHKLAAAYEAVGGGNGL